ncbi:MAG: FlgD immunoglobulin-like domain containing protein [Candidatus Krumholzibacteriia bacterium]
MKNDDAKLTIYNVRGELVTRLIDGHYLRGHHEVTWAGRDGKNRQVASGAYFARFSADNVVQTQRLLLVK